MHKELYPSDLQKINFQMSREWLPFYGTRKKAIEQFGNQMLELRDEDLFVGKYDNQRLKYLLHVTFNQQEMIVRNLLIIHDKYHSLNYERELVDIGKKNRAKSILILLPKKDKLLHDFFISKGYQYIDGEGYLLQLTYHTGLVLGGGGARGAYQIGVWQALEELNISFEMISGTSVGALNGALILQKDLELARDMWQSITTDNILELPKNISEDKYSLNQVLSEWHQLTTTAIQKSGVGTQPLLKLIKELLIPEKIMSTDLPFFVVATTVPSMEEKVMALKDMTKESLPQWLLASSSFYPAMEACLIEGTYYVDGGYKNNIPKDVLVAEGATELIVIDVSGPGLSKKYQVPENIVESNLRSSWSLGTFLLFDGNRSTWNIELGYVETMKLFNQFKGETYAFYKTNFKQDSLKLSREFLQFLSSVPEFEKWYQKKERPQKWQWLINQKVVPELISITLMESLAKKMKITPTQAYHVNELAEEILMTFEENKPIDLLLDSQTMMYSLRELFSDYIKQASPVSEYQIVSSYYHYFNKTTKEQSRGHHLLLDSYWLLALEALFLLFLEKRNR